MTKIIQSSRSVASYAGMFALLAIFVSLGLSSQAYAYNQITSQLDFGARNGNVTNLQTFFADNSAIYPEGMITGYFGGLTKAGVVRFQAQYGLDQVGRVGPMTMAKINSLIIAGGWVTVDTAGPAFYNMNQTQNNTSASFGFSTNENTTARIVYYTSPLMFNEGDINSYGFGPIGGYTVNSSAGSVTSHSITLPNLQPNTTYYYTVIATDAAGNVSVWNPNGTFHTSSQ
jgi:peptidoglycan hydrolase-like protein with peptidoglycan-binding domain